MFFRERKYKRVKRERRVGSDRILGDGGGLLLEIGVSISEKNGKIDSFCAQKMKGGERDKESGHSERCRFGQVILSRKNDSSTSLLVYIFKTANISS